jgi:DNA-binding NarL/FixJ family response regulator
MPSDPAITPDDLRQEFVITRLRAGERVGQATYVRRRQIDAARRQARRCTALKRLPRRVALDPLSGLVLEEMAARVQRAIRSATPRQQCVAQMLMDGLRPCEVARRLRVSASNVTHIVQRLRPLLIDVR